MVQLKETLRSTRIRDLKGALAVLVLEGRAQNAKRVEVVVELPYVSEETYSAAREFMERVAPDVRFRLEGKDGTQAGATKKGAERLRHRAKRTEVAPSSSPSELFTDMNRWLLKYLLIVPSPEPARSLRSLAQAADVSLPTAQRFVEAFGALGHVVRAEQGFRVVRRAELMRRWIAAEKSIRDIRLPARSHYGVRRLFDALALQTSTREVFAASGGFDACRARGVLHVMTEELPTIHVDARAMAMVRGHATSAERHEADFFVVPAATFAASVFRPLVLTNAKHKSEGALRPVDLIQCALDVCKLRSGDEQAQYIIDEVLGWRDGDEA